MEENNMSSNDLYKKLLARLPYAEPFLFIDTILEIDEKKLVASYYFDEKAFFYQGHFIYKPITPGAIMLECMGQVGCVLHGIYLLGLHENNHRFDLVLGLVEGNFFEPLYPNSLVTIEAELQYLRNNHISSLAHLYDSNQQLIAMSRIQCNFIIYDK